MTETRLLALASRVRVPAPRSAPAVFPDATEVEFEIPDAELIAAVRTGDVAAFGELFRRHVGAARRLARQLTRSAAEADDLISEAFERVLDSLLAGSGPSTAFRGYLMRTLRNALVDKARRDHRVLLSDDFTEIDPGVEFVDTALADLENQLVAQALASLPQRWQSVLWRTEVEGESLATVAAALGLTSNGVAALAYRAREGLRQAYLQMHVHDADGKTCGRVARQLGAWVRGSLSRSQQAMVDEHLPTCARCHRWATELVDINSGFRGSISGLRRTG
jgi:RNA polymerase sigma factor (sigma-70 family)